MIIKPHCKRESSTMQVDELCYAMTKLYEWIIVVEEYFVNNSHRLFAIDLHWDN